MAKSRGRDFAIRLLSLIGLLLSMYVLVKRGVGAWYFRANTPDSIQTAIKWDPANPQYYDAMGTLAHVYASSGNANEIVGWYQKATDLSPQDAQYWADLGQGEDWAGNSAEALNALEHARRLFPNSPEINWRLANFYVRTGRPAEALQPLHRVLVGDPALRSGAFALAARAAEDGKALVAILPAQTPLFFDFLDFQIQRGDLSDARDAWAHLLELNLRFDLSESFPYLDALIQRKDLAQLQDAWSALSQRFPAQIEPRASDSNLVTNGKFERDIVNGGLDWRIIPTEGAVVAVDELEGMRALRITFDGSRNLDYAQVFQYVPVKPNTRYAFAGRMRVQRITTDSGPRFQIRDGYGPYRLLGATENRIGDSGWMEEHAEFRTGKDAQLVLLSVVRPASEKFESQISGSVWIDDVSLTAIR